MTLEALGSRLPDYAKDLKLNLSSLSTDPALTEQQRWGALLATALASRNPTVIAAVQAEAQDRLAPQAQSAARTAAAIMGMNNVYYRFLHLVGDGEYRNMPAKLRMNGLANHGIEKLDFELWSLAVSAINGCGLCIEAHEKTLRQHGASREAIQTAIRIAAVIHGVAVTLEGETVAA